MLATLATRTAALAWQKRPIVNHHLKALANNKLLHQSALIAKQFVRKTVVPELTEAEVKTWRFIKNAAERGVVNNKEGSAFVGCFVTLAAFFCSFPICGAFATLSPMVWMPVVFGGSAGVAAWQFSGDMRNDDLHRLELFNEQQTRVLIQWVCDQVNKPIDELTQPDIVANTHMVYKIRRIAVGHL
jgi:hypothetical protein